MSYTNADIAQIFSNIADLLEIKGESRFRFLSYRRASEVIDELPRPLMAYDDETGGLEALTGIGDAIAAKIRELNDTGAMAYYDKLIAEVPLSLIDIMRINGVGPKKAAMFWKELGITTVEELKTAATEGRLRDLPKMGEKSEQKILAGIEALSRYTGRTRLGDAYPQARSLLDALLELDESVRGEIAGSIRRGRPTIGDVDLLIASDNAEPIMQRFIEQPGINRVLGEGATKTSIEMNSGLQVDLRVVPESHWGTALVYFTGSKNHNIRLRDMARSRQYTLNEDAYSPVDSGGNIVEDGERITCSTEADVYHFLDLPYIAPELREDAGEFEAARDGTLPDLIGQSDIVASLHCHTNWSDGKLSITELIDNARENGISILCITDHSQRSMQASGLSVDRLWQQRDAIREAAASFDDITVLHGVEMDILESGEMDYDDSVLEQLDVVVASLHFGITQPREQVTQRLLNAINNPHVDIIAHPTARLLNQRAPADLDMDAVLEAAQNTQTALEINANYYRLDLDASYVRRCVELNIPVSINTDAHRYDDFRYISYGISTARRGWLSAAQTINTWPLHDLRHWLKTRERPQT